jgi:hypothetical protein
VKTRIRLEADRALSRMQLVAPATKILPERLHCCAVVIDMAMARLLAHISMSSTAIENRRVPRLAATVALATVGFTLVVEAE